MKRFPFKKLDAFATEFSAGNPAGYIALNKGDEITPDEMLKIARQLKGFVNEVGFVNKAEDGSFRFKYYSSECEVQFCGHATIAIANDIIKNDPSLIAGDSIYITTNKGKLKIENRIKEENSVYIFSPKPEFVNSNLNFSDIIISLNAEESFIDRDLPVSIVNAGLNTLIVPIRGLDAILGIQPDEAVLKDFCIGNGIDIIEVFSSEVSDRKNDYRTRVFAPAFGYLEDPATGSGNSAFGHYLLENSLWETGHLNIEQNNEREKYNIIKLRTAKDDNNEWAVLFGGPAVVRIEGEYIIY